MNTNDFGAAGQLLADGYRLEWPQSGETVRGRDNFARLNQSCPANGVWRFTVHRLLADGAEVVSGVSVTDGVLETRYHLFYSSGWADRRAARVLARPF